MQYKLILPMRAVPKGRPKFVRGKVITPRKTQDAERTIKIFAISKGVRPQPGPIEITIQLMFKRPKLAKHSYPSIGDIDNFTKLIYDALNGVAYADDSQIVKAITTKSYGSEDLIVIEIKPFVT